MTTVIRLTPLALLAALLPGPAFAQKDMKPRERHMLVGQYGDVALVKVPAFTTDGQEILTRVCRGTCVDVVETKPDPKHPTITWHKVRISSGGNSGKEGWVSSRHVVKDDGELDKLIQGAVPQVRKQTAARKGAAQEVGLAVADAKTLKQPDIRKAEFAGEVKKGECFVVVERKADPSLPATEWCRVKSLSDAGEDKGWVQAHRMWPWQWGQVKNRTGQDLLVYGPANAGDKGKLDNSLYRLPNGHMTPEDWDCDGFFVPKGYSYDGTAGPIAAKFKSYQTVVVTAAVKAGETQYIVNSWHDWGKYKAKEINWPIPDIDFTGVKNYAEVPGSLPDAVK